MPIALPRKPLFGARRSGSATSALIPHNTVVSPKRTRAEPSADVIEPLWVREVS